MTVSSCKQLWSRLHVIRRKTRPPAPASYHLTHDPFPTSACLGGATCRFSNGIEALRGHKCFEKHTTISADFFYYPDALKVVLEWICLHSCLVRLSLCLFFAHPLIFYFYRTSTNLHIFKHPPPPQQTNTFNLYSEAIDSMLNDVPLL